jgi:(p)ppGpp synthase/HD superfamily hydrolase
MDYLWMHGPLIEKSSYLESYFAIPATVEELSTMLPGSTQFKDIDDLLVTIGKQNDRSLLHTFVSKLFRVPQKLLLQAEKNRSSLVPNSVLDAVYNRRKTARDAAAAADSAQSTTFAQPKEIVADRDTSFSNNWPKPSNNSTVSIDRILSTGVDLIAEYADPEHLCITCLPVYGDEIVGTRPEGAPLDSTPKVHRLGCPHAQRAINRALAENRRPAADIFNYEFGQRVDSETLRRSINSGYQEPTVREVPVKLEWSEFVATGDYDLRFPCEIVVHADDRKLLLADCSEIVSELSEIVKTGSQTTNEHATLVFLIKVRSLGDLQKVMNSLQRIRSVMAVERRVSILRLIPPLPPKTRSFTIEIALFLQNLLQFGSELFGFSIP